MKKLILAAIAAVISVGAVLPAAAVSYRDCSSISSLGASTGYLASHCNQFIPSQGLISGGKHEGKEWGKVFKNVNFGAEITHIKVDKKKTPMEIGGKRITYIYKTKSDLDAIKTKKISVWNWTGYKEKVGYLNTEVWGE